MTVERLRSFRLVVVACLTTASWLLAGCVAVPDPNRAAPNPEAAPSFDSRTSAARPASDDASRQRRARARFELAVAYYQRAQLDVALEEVQSALQADPDMSDAYNLRGLILSARGDDGLAEDSFRRGIALNPRDADAMHNYGWFMCQRRRYPEAAAMFQQALAVPQYLGASRTMLTSGICEWRAGHLDTAEASLKRAYDLDPTSPVIAVNLAEVLFQRGDLDRARFYIRRVNQSDETTNAQSLWLAAKIEMKLGNTQGANDLGAKLRSKFPKSRESLAFDRGAFNE